MATITLSIPTFGHTLAGTLRQILDAGGNAVRIETKPQSPFAGDPEFDSSSLSAWTQVNGANATLIDANATKKSHLRIACNANSSNWQASTRTSPYVYQVVSGNFDVYAHVTFGTLRDFAHVGIMAQSTGNNSNWFGSLFYFDSSVAYLEGVQKSTVSDVSTNSSTNIFSSSSTTAAEAWGIPIYLRLNRVTNDFRAWYSLDGLNWTAIGSAVTRGDFSSDARVGIVVGTANTLNATIGSCDFLRTWPPYDTTSPTSSVILDSGLNGTTWGMSSFLAFINEYKEFSPYSQIGFGTLKYQYGASDSSPPTLNGTWLSQASMQAQSNPSGRYFKLAVQYNSPDGYELCSFAGGSIQATISGGVKRRPKLTTLGA